MSKKFLTNIDLNGNQLLNVVLQNLASDPSSPAAGQFWYNSTNNLFKWYNGTIVVDPLSRANHSGTQLASTISNLASTVQAYSISTFAAPTTDMSMAGYKITNLATPITSTDAATKGYVDSAVAGLSWKAATQAATTTNLTATYSNGSSGVGATLTNTGTQAAFVVDGYTTFVGDRILVKNQATQTQNGIYVVTSVGSGSTNWVLTRASDSNTTALLVNEAVFVENGTTLATTGWVQTTVAPTIGSANIVYTQFSGSGSYSAGSGLTLTGNTFSIGASQVTNTMLVNSSVTVTAGTGLSGGGSVSLGGSVTLSNAGVTSNVAGTGISLSGATGAVTISNTGVTGITAGTGLTASASTGAVTISYNGTVMNKYSQLIGDGSSTSIAVTHSLGTRDVVVAVYDSSSYAEVNCDVTHTSASVVTFGFSVAPVSNAFKVVIIG